MRALAVILVVAACGSPHSSAVTLPAASASAPVALGGSCAVRVAAPRAITVPPALEALAPQYFHPSVDDPFNDLVANTNRYRLYDPESFVAIDPPAGMNMIRRATKSFYFGWGDSKALVARRVDGKTIDIDARRGRIDLDMIEDARGHAWLLTGGADASTLTNLEVLEISPSLEARSYAVAVSSGVDPRDRRVGLTADGHVAVVWVEGDESGLRLMATWLTPRGFDVLTIVDGIAVAREAVDLSLRSTTSLRVASDEADRLAVAWRPIVPKEGRAPDVGTQSRPPERGALAEVRIVTFDVQRVGPVRVHATRAEPLGFTSGIGPWPLQANGMAAATIARHALFFWLDGDRLVLATSTDPKPRPVTTGSYRIVPRAPSRAAVDVLLLRSAGGQQAVSVSCD